MLLALLLNSSFVFTWLIWITYNRINCTLLAYMILHNPSFVYTVDHTGAIINKFGTVYTLYCTYLWYHITFYYVPVIIHVLLRCTVKFNLYCTSHFWYHYYNLQWCTRNSSGTVMFVLLRCTVKFHLYCITLCTRKCLWYSTLHFV